jgi:hypothetical protein
MLLHCKSIVLMPIKTSPAPTDSFTVTLPVSAIKMLEKLAGIGLHGNSRAEVARSLILSRLEDLIGKGVLTLNR